MLLLGSMWLGLLIAGLLPGGFRIEIGPLLVGGTLAALEWRLRRPALTAFLALLTIEELLTWWALTSGVALRSVDGAARVGPFVVGVCIVALLLARVRLPEGGLPLRGIWLRRLLAGSALLALIAWSSWLYFLTQAAVIGVLLWPLLPCLLMACTYIVRTADILARHSLPQADRDPGPTT